MVVWGVVVIALATGILFCSFFTETWAQDARDAAESVAREPRLHGLGAAWALELPPPTSNAPLEQTFDRAPSPEMCARACHPAPCAEADRLHAVTGWLRVCAVMYLLLGLGADWLCTTLIR